MVVGGVGVYDLYLDIWGIQLKCSEEEHSSTRSSSSKMLFCFLCGELRSRNPPLRFVPAFD